MSRAVCSRRASSLGGVVWRNIPAGPVKVPTCRRCSSSRARPGRARSGAGAGLDDPDQEQGEPAEQDVGADAVFEPVDRPGAGPGSVSCPASRVRPRAAACSPGRCPRRTGAGRWCAAGTCRPVSRPRRPWRRRGAAARRGWCAGTGASPGRVEITPRSSARFVRAEPVRAGDHRLQLGDERSRGRRRRGRRRRGCGRPRTARAR